MADVIAILRASCVQRAAGAAVDEPGLTGVLAGSAPILWASEGVDIARMQTVLAASPEVREVYVDERTPLAADALLATAEWTSRQDFDQQVFSPGGQELPVPAAPCAITPAGPTDMPLMRRALATAFQVPIRAIEAAYPDDFFVCAAPARLFVARCDSGEVIGTVGHRLQADAAMLFALSVRSDQRRREVGTALLSAAMRSAIDDGATLLHGLTCEPTRGVADRLGFQRVGGWRYLVRRSPRLVPEPRTAGSAD